MAIADDIAKAKELSLIHSKISDLNTRIKAAIANFEQRKISLAQDKDEEIKAFFKKALDNPEIKVVSTNDEITGKYGNNLLYSLKINDKEKVLIKKLDSVVKAYKFKYTFSTYLPEVRSVDTLGSKTIDDVKNKEIESLENHLQKCYHAMEKLTSEGVQIEYVQMEKGELFYPSMTSEDMERFNADKYTKINIQGLLKLIGIEEVKP